ncbi:hypothetical protein JT358_14970 [Micrococcales bacterium 31B]|nr:hypothetical protein [Micrococcales bacterium 31B]
MNDPQPAEQADASPVESVLQVLGELEQLVTEARAVPMTGNCVVNREHVLAFIDALREAIPDQISRADALQQEAATAVEIAYREAEGIIVKAKHTADELSSREEVAQRAAVKARDIVSRAEANAAELMRSSDLYVARNLQAFEDQLETLQQQAQRGRELVQQRLRRSVSGDSGDSAGAASDGEGGNLAPGASATEDRVLTPAEKAAVTGLPSEVFEESQGLSTYVKSEGPRHTGRRRAQW